MIDLLLKFFGLPLQITRAPFQRLLLRRALSSRQRLAIPHTAEPLAQLEIGEEQQANQIQCTVDDSRAHRSEHPKEILMQGESNKPTNTRGANGRTRPADERGVILEMRMQIQQVEPPH